jgi:Right handed beta helix region
MIRRKARQGPPKAAGRHSWLTALAAVFLFGLLASTPLVLRDLHVVTHPVAAASAHGIALLPRSVNPHLVQVPPVARAINPGQPAALPPTARPAKEAALVTEEDNRIRTLFHAAVHINRPEVVPARSSLPTLVLTPRRSPYRAVDLVRYGALVRLPHRADLLLYDVFVAPRATLLLGSPRLRALYLDSSGDGFASVVTWGGHLDFRGTSRRPFTIMGWDRVAKAPAADRGNGRSYIRAIGGSLSLTDARVSALGFWSGRTGGVAWTGLRNQPSTGGATSSTFTSSTYGAFVMRGKDVRFADDLFEFNQLDGVHIHRYSVGSSVISSSLVRNGLNGLMVDRATQLTLAQGDVSVRNRRNGYFVDGRPLVAGASASGNSVAPGSGATIEGSVATHNGRAGILVEGGVSTVIKANQVCAPITGISIKYGAANSVLTGNYVSCSPQSGLSLGPRASNSVASGNTIVGSRIGMLIRNVGQLRIDNNLVARTRIFGISVRGLSSRVSGVGNTIAGTGFRPVDTRAQARVPTLYGTDTSGWAHHAKLTFFSYLRFHPLAALWLSIVLLFVIGFLWSRRRRLPPHPYPESTRWRPPTPRVRPLPVREAAGPVPAMTVADAFTVPAPSPELTAAAAAAMSAPPPTPTAAIADTTPAPPTAVDAAEAATTPAPPWVLTAADAATMPAPPSAVTAAEAATMPAPPSAVDAAEAATMPAPPSAVTAADAVTAAEAATMPAPPSAATTADATTMPRRGRGHYAGMAARGREAAAGMDGSGIDGTGSSPAPVPAGVAGS